MLNLRLLHLDHLDHHAPHQDHHRENHHHRDHHQENHHHLEIKTDQILEQAREDGVAAVIEVAAVAATEMVETTGAIEIAGTVETKETSGAVVIVVDQIQVLHEEPHHLNSTITII
jgi:hypothetical protein